MKLPRKRPHSVSVLNQWVDTHARQTGQSVPRVRNWVSYMILGGALERAGFGGEGPKFTIKGGVALELRLRELARATRDLDLVLNHPEADLIEELENALAAPHEGFTFRRKGEPERMPNGAVRVQVALQYSGRPWATVQVDVARRELDRTEVDLVDAIDLRPLGLNAPEQLPCLSLRYHIAQKIHAMTLPPEGDRVNDRFRDLVDLLLLRDLVTDYDTIRDACKEVFTYRDTHAWPPSFEVPEQWVEPFARLAEDVELGTTDIYQAVVDLRAFLYKVDEAFPFFVEAEIPEPLTATTWYYAIGSDDHIHRVPTAKAESIMDGDYQAEDSLPSEWQRDPGGVALVGVVVLLSNRRPVFVERAELNAAAVSSAAEEKSVALAPSLWTALAEAIIRQAKVPRRATQALATFLSTAQGSLPYAVGRYVGLSTREASKVYAQFNNPRKDKKVLWDLRTGQPVKPKRNARRS